MPKKSIWLNPRLCILVCLLLPGCSDMMAGDTSLNNGYHNNILSGNFVINNNADITTNKHVTLDIDVDNAEQMRFRNGEGPWSDWEDAASRKEWILDAGSGLREVEAEFADSESNILPLSDSIVLLDKLQASDGGVEDHFGTSVDISADGLTVVVGVPGDNGNDSGFYEDQGAVYVFHWDGNSWVETRLTGSTCLAHDAFGISVAISDDGRRIAAGAPYYDATYQDQGGVFVFELDTNDVWRETDLVVASGGSADDRFGYAVSLSGNGVVLAAGAPYDDTGRGSVHLFSLTSGSWSNYGTVHASNAQDHDHFGLSVSLSFTGGALAVGAPERTIDYNADHGAAYSYVRSGSSWMESILQFTEGVGYDYFGSSVAISGDGTVIAVGARGHRCGASDRQGSAYVYRFEGGLWRRYEVPVNDGAPYDYFGCSIALSYDGAVLLVGAHLDDYLNTDQGTASLYLWNGGAASYQFQELYYAYDGVFEDRFGTALAITPIGTTMVIGSSHDEGGVLNQGSVYLYAR